MMKLLDDKPDMYLDEIAFELTETLGVIPSLATVHRTLKLLGYTSKKVSCTISYNYMIISIYNSSQNLH